MERRSDEATKRRRDIARRHKTRGEILLNIGEGRLGESGTVAITETTADNRQRIKESTMARIEGVAGKKAGLFVRLVYFMTRRKIGRVVTPVKITAHHPRLLRAYGHMEMGQEAATTVPLQLKTLAQVKVAMQIGCPF